MVGCRQCLARRQRDCQMIPKSIFAVVQRGRIKRLGRSQWWVRQRRKRQRAVRAVLNLSERTDPVAVVVSGRPQCRGPQPAKGFS
jgi:hypothetical protein